MKTKTSLLVALFAAAAFSAHAQTSVPTPKSVAPDYKPPQSVSTSPAQTTYTYQAPHAGTWDFYVVTGAWFFDDFKMKANNVRIGSRPNEYSNRASGKMHIDLDDSWFIGFGAGYNITEQLSVHAQFAFTNPDYSATFVGETRDGDPVTRHTNHEADIGTGDISIRYDLMTGKFRPFVQGSIGFMYIDTNIINGHGWGHWDSWDNYYWDTPTVDDTYFTLGATAGANIYFSKHVFGQLSYTCNWASTSGNGMMNHRVNVSVGWNY
ncbi:hypothetical protein M2447_002754 [Ereboglobus sp. PH5-10]|uniref:outer membrane beta-barrel protein n=1 Tax=Ereboglobus sp. PH5-10 TaxID=2940629 RepID=UPI0024059189|nr:outer membrane beta-barrel protein [Ereboglobus sp. PH5-10]MDF9828626.1 hypothetical protein [Ereboglobus sp. PH5-10]